MVQEGNLTTGQKSTNLKVDGFGYGTVQFSRNDLWNRGEHLIPYKNHTNVEQHTRSENVSVQLFPNNHISDTEASIAWKDGWTGAGQTIAVIDDFSNKEISAASKVEIPRKHDYSNSFWNGFGYDNASSTYTHTFEYYVVKSESHGDLVSSIAGGGGAGSEVTEVHSLYSKKCVDGCSSLPGNLSSGDWNSITGFSQSSEVVYAERAGVAKDAFLVRQDVDLTGIISTRNTLLRIASHIDNSSEFSAINLSLGMNIPTSNVSYSQVLEDMKGFSLENNSSAVVVVSAGNSGAPCRQSNLNGCNAVAVALTANEKVNKNLLVVGATEGTGLSEQIASYSTRPGFLKSRFIYAQGDSGYHVSSSGDKIKGTSFAAPRVTGAAAILRQKFPNLSGAEAATILLETASKDFNGDGINDFSGISDTFGNGKLDLMSALSPIGKLELN